MGGGSGSDTDCLLAALLRAGCHAEAAAFSGDDALDEAWLAAASTADGLLLVVDASRAPEARPVRQARVAALQGVRHVVLAVNKLDRMDFDEARFKAVAAAYQDLIADEFASFSAIPLSALDGDNVAQHSDRTPWYVGPSLCDALSALSPASGEDAADAAAHPERADQFEAQLLWLGKAALVPGRQYRIRLAGQDGTAMVTRIKHRLDTMTRAQLSAKRLGGHDLATVNLATAVPVAFEPRGGRRRLSRFILFDLQTGEQAGVGCIEFALRRASNLHWQAMALNKTSRAAIKSQTPCCIWFTGLSGSGKSTVANMLEKQLHVEGKHTYLLDGDNVRHGLNRDLGFTEADRVENIRRVAEVARLMVDAGLIVLVSFISPFRSERRMARSLFGSEEFVEVFVDTPIAACEARDVKGLYAKARRGELKNFTGIDSPYEPPECPEVRLDTLRYSPDACAGQVLNVLLGGGSMVL